MNREMKKYIVLLVCVCGFITSMHAQFQYDCDVIQYYDWDGDGYGDPAYPFDPQNPNLYIYTPPSHAILVENNRVCNDFDCDDTDPQINPDMYWATVADNDNDGHYTITSVVQGCENIPLDAVLIDLNNTSNLLVDCDDSDPNLQSFKAYYNDTDGDGFGDLNDVIYSCSGAIPSGYVENGGDWCPDTYGTYNGCSDTTNQVGINQNRNYVHSVAFQTPTQLQDISNVQSKDRIEQITYFDGMGRGQMQIAIGQSPKDNRDIKTLITYDEYGRTANSFLPYVDAQRGGDFAPPALGDISNNGLAMGEIRKQQQFYHNKYADDISSETNANGLLTILAGVNNLPQDLQTMLDQITLEGAIQPTYSSQVFDEIDRVTEQAAPGEAWSIAKGHTIKMTYQLNDSLVDAVKRFDVSNPSSLVYAGSYYPTGTLYKTITKDENWKEDQTHVKDHTTEEFKNKSGQVLLKRTYDLGVSHDTYYVYDDFGNLKFVLPPMAMSQPSIDSNVLDKFCYQYRYDYRNRLIEKKIPAKGWEYIIYDTLDRPVLTQDVNLRTNGLWLFTKYDGLGRVVYTGKYASTATRTNLQNTVSASTTIYETKTATATSIGDATAFYSNNAFPTTGLELLSVNYYDNYLWDVGTSYEANYNFYGNNGITTTGIVHQKTAGLPASWTNAGFNTQGAIQGDGYIQYTIAQTDKRIMVGLSKEADAEDIHYTSIGYAIYTGYGSDKRVFVYKDGTVQSSPVTYCEIGDTFRVERSGNQILFKKNGQAFHSLIANDTETLVGDASFCDPEVAIENVYIGYSVMGQDFTQNVKGMPTGSKVRILDTNDWITTASYYDEKGRAIHTTSNNNYLQTSDAVSNLLDFTGKVLQSNTTHKQASNDPVVTNDAYVYDTNNRLLYQTKQINNGNRELIARNHYDELGQLTQKQVGGRLEKVSNYENVNNISQSKELLTKTSATAWDGGLTTTTTITADGYLSYVLPQANKTMMIGLSDVVGNDSYGSIKYAIYTTSNGDVHIRDNYSVTWDVSSYNAGDEFKIERRADQIHYLQNNVTIHISDSLDSGAPLLGDVAMYHINSSVKNLVLVDLEKELQEVDYTYNVRGWLKGINDVNNQGNDLFSFALNYNDIVDPTKQLFNGNISSTLWRSKGQDSSVKNYVYDYDALNRITSAVDNTGNYNLDEVEYDQNGNIRRLQRSGHRNEAASVFGVMDQLVYAYNGNQLQKVTDHVGIEYGFKDGTNTGDDYSYDANGNMIEDKNKGITSITYNHLNLPTQISFDNGNSISYIYDASGVKQQKIVNDQSTENVQETHYAGNYIYKKASSKSPLTLTFFNSEEGYVEPIFKGTGVINGFQYTYQYKDHLGNIRLSYEDIDGNGEIDAATEIKEENHYYPFGLKHEGYNANQIGNNYNLKEFQGQEFTENLGLNIHEWKYRVSDPTIGRFWQIDPLAEDYVYNGVYNFSENRVIDAVELEGLEAMDYKVTMREASKAQTKALDQGASYEESKKIYRKTMNPDLSGEPLSENTQKALNGIGNITFGTIGAIGSALYIAGTSGTGAAAGGATGLVFSLGEISIGVTQLTDAMFNDSKNEVIHESSSIPGLIANQAGSENAEFYDAVGQFMPGLFSGGNIATIIENGGKVIARKGSLLDISSTIDASMDTKGLFDAAREFNSNSKKNKSIVPQPISSDLEGVPQKSILNKRQ